MDQVMENTELRYDSEKLMINRTWIGVLPVNIIMEHIKEQFRNYNTIEDEYNYVSQFYSQLDESIKSTYSIDVMYRDDMRDTLKGIEEEFVDFIVDLIKTTLDINIDIYESDTIDFTKMRLIVSSIYEGLILNAKRNFKEFITFDISERLSGRDVDRSNSEELLKEITELIDLYDPLITGVSIIDFLAVIKEEALLYLYKGSEINGNFLKKYSPKLYQNLELKTDIILNAVLVNTVMGEIINGKQ